MFPLEGIGWRIAGVIPASVILTTAMSTALAEDRHAGYYYPIPATSEIYTARAVTLPDASRKRRILFVTELSNQMLNNAYPPPVAIFAKGEEAEKLIITALYADGYNTLYRMRGLLAMLSARARTTPIFRAYEVEDLFTFFDLLKLLGFEQLTVTDGDRFAHQIEIK
ncbi:MAG TPA: molybdopterin-guanine dinucleotide biosynthesis protein A [Gammaproteobacteria bacterium]|nr:molybdopterin-guanine dinucleotide biosynthesis protein A [Gammaproteobacteria bacterium]